MPQSPTSPTHEDTVVRNDAAKALAAHMALDIPGFAQIVLEHQAERIRPVREDPEVQALTLSTCAVHIEAMFSMIRLGIPAERTETPVVAIEHARRLAARGVSIDDMLRIYRVGQARFWAHWSAALIEHIDDREDLGAALQDTAAFVFAYSDAVSTRVSLEHFTELQRRQQRATAKRADVVKAIIDRQALDLEIAERTLGHRLAGRQLAYVCWVAEPSALLDGAAIAVARAAGSERPLLLPTAEGEISGWVVPAHDVGVDAEALLAAAAAVSPEVNVAVGEPGQGLDGFRRSHAQALSARRIAQLSGRPAPHVTAWDDVALVDLLSRDLDAARDLVAVELGALARRGESAAGLREALMAYLVARGSHIGAAAALGVHRNTALYRLHRAEELRGRPITERQFELHAALLLCAHLGDEMLSD